MDYYQKSGNNMQAADDQVIQPMDTTDTNGTEVKEESTAAAAAAAPPPGVHKKPWERPNYVKMKKKKNTENKNLRLKKFVTPRNAIMCLNELRPSLEYKTEQESTGVGQPFCLTVEVDGQTYRGYGSSKLLAKQAAAEAALISFVKPPVPKDAEGEQEDKTPWATLASFAVYKLFNDWREGRVGMCQPPTQQFGSAAIPHLPIQTFTNYISPEKADKPKISTANPPAFVPPTTVMKEDPKVMPKRAKQLPDNAAGMHPAMLLHQMRPDIVYSLTQELKESKPYFNVTGTIDNVTYSGEGQNMKKAKFNMAVAALKQIFDIDSNYVSP